MQPTTLLALMGTLSTLASALPAPQVIVTVEKEAIATKIVTVGPGGETILPSPPKTHVKEVVHHKEEDHHKAKEETHPHPAAAVHTEEKIAVAPENVPAAPAAPPATTSAPPAETSSPPPTTPSDSSSGSGSSSSGGSAPGDMQSVLDAHNAFRAKHSASPLTWSDELASSSEAANSKLDGGCSLVHSGAGENLASGSAGSSPESLTQMWLDEGDGYDYSSTGFSDSKGHFTQVVWKATTQLGCHLANVGGCAMPAVLRCQYKEAGNMAGAFTQNVS